VVAEVSAFPTGCWLFEKAKEKDSWFPRPVIGV